VAGAIHVDARQVVARSAMVMGAWIVLVLVLVGAGEIVVNSPSIEHFDRHATSVVVGWRSPALNAAMKAMTWAGSWVALTVAAIIIALLVLRHRLRPTVAIIAVVAWVGEVAGVRIGKVVVERHRPPKQIWLVHAHGWSFPSGHAATAAVVFGMVALVATTLAPRASVRVAAWTVAAVAVALTAFSRIELGVHWTTDVVAGVLFVAAWLVMIELLVGGALRPGQDGDGEACVNSVSAKRSSV
jgi:undecaprenyl-diphosphatase